LVVYTSMSVDQAQRILDVFKARYPFLKTTMFRAVGERLLTKIMTEAQAGKYDFDAVQSAESQAYFLKKKNLLQKYVSPETKNIQKPFFDPEGYWAAVYIMPNVIAYNTRMIKRNEVPKTDEDLLNPKWKGKMGMDHTKPEWFAWKLKRMGEEKGSPPAAAYQWSEYREQNRVSKATFPESSVVRRPISLRLVAAKFHS